jgi:hypothetical protein
MKWLLIILALFAGNLCAKEYGSVTVLEVTSIYNADTFREILQAGRR